jgi:putative transposase
MPTVAVKYRLYPTPAQESVLRRTLATCCAVYNSLVNWRRYDYEMHGASPSYYAQKRALPVWKQTHEELTAVHSQVLQDVAKRVDLAFAAFFRRVNAGETPGYPRFKGAGHYDSLTYPQEAGFQVGADTLTLSKIGTVQAVIHRALPGKAKTCTVRVQAGKWFACVACEVETQPLPESGEQVGIDVGLEHFAATSDGEFVANPRFFRKDEKALAKAQRKVERLKVIRTKQQKAKLKKARRVVSRVHERIRNRRHDFVHQTARRLVNRFGLIAVENLNVSGMVQNHCLSKSIADAGWRMFRAVLSAKAESAARVMRAVNPAYTSQDCSECGERVQKTLSERVHVCARCGLVLQRDVNAARNILKRAVACGQGAIAVGQHSDPA